jgi:hypothetical protein
MSNQIERRQRDMKDFLLAVAEVVIVAVVLLLVWELMIHGEFVILR